MIILDPVKLITQIIYDKFYFKNSPNLFQNGFIAMIESLIIRSRFSSIVAVIDDMVSCGLTIGAIPTDCWIDLAAMLLKVFV